jgi:FtsP/CotA-like multicopper oxidase with cupredoxin domain
MPCDLMNRRDFLKLGIASGFGLSAGGCGNGAGGSAAGAPVLVAPAAAALRGRTVSPDGLSLTARQVIAEVAPGVRSAVLSYGDGPLGPTIEARPGQRVEVELTNALDEPTVLHWHGLRPPEAADGHPRLALDPGGIYRYAFELDEAAGLYWYHSHAHMRTAPQVYFGLAGLFIVRDEAEAALELPAGDREVTLVLQDKRQDATGQILYSAMGHQLMEGFLGDVPFVNGSRPTRIEVDSAMYRLRVLAAANARIYRLALSNGRPLRLIGSDGGFLRAPVELPFVDMGTGERTDLLVDFAGLPAGTVVTLRSLDFPDPAGAMGMGMMGRGMMGAGGLRQGAPIDLVEFVVAREVDEPARVSSALVDLPRLARATARRERVFRFASAMMTHTINGRSFAMDRIDERVAFGDTEVWRFVNEAPFPHPVHMHAVHFQVLSRRGGRGAVLPWETGWKDTVMVFPGEEVEVIARFDRHRGIYLLHCHNLEHEDLGMMMNFVIE